MATSTTVPRELWLPPIVAPWNDRVIDGSHAWTPANFAREQIRGLVRQVFFSNASQPVRQVVISGADSQTDVSSICRQVGEALAAETQAGIAVVGCGAEILDAAETEQPFGGRRMVEGQASRPQASVKSNLWFISNSGVANAKRSPFRSNAESHVAYARLAELRREFEYSIIASAPAGESSDAAAMGQLADGVVLVLAANRTRRATARRIMDSLRTARVHLLGLVLSDRTFPIPEGIYRRL
jgi:hypothetical protein